MSLTTQTMTNRHKRTRVLCPLVDSPYEVLGMILSYVADTSMVDLAACSLTCRKVRSVSVPILFRDIYCTWPLLPKLIPTLDQNSITSHIRGLHIIKSSSWGEWHCDSELVPVLKACPRIIELDLVLSGSSGWMKYVSPDLCASIETLVVRSQVSINYKDNKANTSVPFPQFDFGDIHKFAKVKTLTIQGFQISDTSELEEESLSSDSHSVLEALESVHLVNSIWSYPFDFTDIDSLRHLSISYSPSYLSYTYLERLKSLAQGPPVNLTSLELNLPDNACKPWHALSHISNASSLRQVELRGFELPSADYFNSLPDSINQFKVYTPYNDKRQPTDLVELAGRLKAQCKYTISLEDNCMVLYK
uniref:ARAD1C08118p n=1 Tax=Blastobotrys adeninivorans TaxID=409370 RepID=A0A060T0I0_BLAAD